MTLMFSNVRYENEILGIEANGRKINMSEKKNSSTSCPCMRE